MKNKKFFFLQYNKINWRNQEKTRINERINEHIVDNVLSKHDDSSLSLYDIGFGIGFFFKIITEKLEDKFSSLILSGCEPSRDNFEYFNDSNFQNKHHLDVEESPFLNANIQNQYDFASAIYVFPHFTSDDLEDVVQKIYSILKPKGKFILVVANEEYIKNKLDKEKDLFIETNVLQLNGKEYEETLHYSEIPEIGKLIDYNREEDFYIDLFNENGFELSTKETFDDNGFLATLFVFEKE